jgi:peptide/nickel transport system substrate-binding protein
VPVFLGVLLLFASLSAVGATEAAPRTLVIPIAHLPKAIDPHLGNDIPLNKMARQVFETLVGLDEGLAPVPQLARRWEVDAPKGLVRFFLDETHRFSDGTPVTAAAVERSLVRSRVHGNPILSQVRSVRVVKPAVLELRIAGQNVPLLFKKLASMDGSIVREANGKLLGSGPFVVVGEDAKGVWMVRRKAAKDARTIERIEFRKVAPAEAAGLFRRGEIHEIDDIQLDYPTGPLAEGEAVEIALPATYFLALNLRKMPFKNRDARQALADAIDRSAFLAGVGVAGWPCFGVVPRGMLGHRATGPGPARRRKSSGSVVVGVPERNRGLAAFETTLPAALREAGFEPTIRFLSFAEMLAELRGNRLDAVYKGDAPRYFDSASMYDSLSTKSNSNVTGFSSPELDELLLAVDQAATDADRLTLLQRLEAVVQRENPVIPLFNRALRVAYRRELALPPRFALYLQQWDVPYHSFLWKVPGER